jgi:hypothetical protein
LLVLRDEQLCEQHVDVQMLEFHLAEQKNEVALVLSCIYQSLLLMSQFALV